ncbi:GNAT family N-acetyltransferase [Chloroflexi bacterium TSY]|nr:GNAT family N-acetyltransferase [Chloroflexi bacterium TSY]
MYEYHRPPFTISTDPARLNLEVIHEYLTHSYWSPGIPKNVVEKAIAHSFNFGLYDGHHQIGFARVITDYATFAYLADVFVLQEYRGKGLGIWLIDCVTNCEALDGIRTFTLATRDAHGLYQKFGFETAVNSERWMSLKYEIPWYQPELVVEG